MNKGWIWTWLPRIAAVLMTLFIALFALDALQGEGGLVERSWDLAIHLIPAALCSLAVVFAWERPWLGAITFAGFVAFYGWYAWDHIGWVLVIGGPLLLVSALYLASAFQPRQQPN